MSKGQAALGYRLQVAGLRLSDWYLLLLSIGADAEHRKENTAMINLIGVIEAKGESNAENLVAALNSAFDEKMRSGSFCASTVRVVARSRLASSTTKSVVSAPNILKSHCMPWSKICVPLVAITLPLQPIASTSIRPVSLARLAC